MMRESLTFKFWRWILIGAPVWWLLGLNMLIYHAATAFLFLGLVYTSSRFSEGLLFPISAGFFLFISAFYLLSILIHTVFESAGGRVVASLYNLSFWIMGFMIVMVLANSFSKLEIMPALKSAETLAWVIGGTALVMLWLWQSGTKQFIIETPLYKLGGIFGRTQLVESSLLARVLMIDWFASASRPRFNIFSPYPTAAGGLILIMLVLIITKAAIDRKLLKYDFIILAALNGLALVMTLSRMSILAFIFSFLIVFILQKRNVSVWLVVLFISLVLALPWLQETLRYFLSLREDSNSIRLELYKYSLEQLDGIDWVLGFGVKPREDSFIFPIGSHSTYISMLFKCGVIGLILWIVFQATLLWRWYELKSYAARRRLDFLFWRGLGWIFIAMAFWAVTEDIDAPQLLCFLYFSMIGVFEGFRRRLLA